MNISNISNQIEIAFWMGIVLLLRDRRVSRVVTLSLIGLLCMVALLLMAFSWAYIGQPRRTDGPKVAAIQTMAYLGRPENGQSNLLLILVDRLDEAEPVLEGAWMLIYAPSGLKVSFMPIYPVSAKASPNLRRSFSLENRGDLPAAFEQALQAQGLWWDNYLIVDHEDLAALVEITGGIDLGDGRSNGQQVVDLLPIADQDAQTALELQARIAQGICQRFDSTLRNAGPETMVKLLIGDARSISAHTDLTPERLLASWKRMRSTGGLACDFPTLSGR